MVAGYQINTQNLVTFVYEIMMQKRKSIQYGASQSEYLRINYKVGEIFMQKTSNNNKTKMTQEVETHCSMNWNN